MKDYVYVNCVGTSDLQSLSRRELRQFCCHSPCLELSHIDNEIIHVRTISGRKQGMRMWIEDYNRGAACKLFSNLARLIPKVTEPLTGKSRRYDALEELLCNAIL